MILYSEILCLKIKFVNDRLQINMSLISFINLYKKSIHSMDKLL